VQLADFQIQDRNVAQATSCDPSRADFSCSQWGATSRVVWSDCIQLGSTTYPLARSVIGNVTLDDGQWVLRMAGLSPTFSGKGKTPAKAEQDFKRQVHVAFQCLYCKRPFQMMKEEFATWTLLQNFIDIAAYIRKTPIDTQEIGTIEWLRGVPHGISAKLQIRWLDGRVEYIPLERAPGEFAALRPGQWFEAIVRRDPISLKLLRLLRVERTEPVQPMRENQVNRYWDQLSTTKALTKADLP
jgi:hypothetical protein